jgi:hypothetical protein
MGEQLTIDPSSSAKNEKGTPYLRKTNLSIGLFAIFFLGGQIIGLFRLDRGVNLRVSTALFLAMGLVLFARGIKQKAANLSSDMKEVQEGTNDDPA